MISAVQQKKKLLYICDEETGGRQKGIEIGVLKTNKQTFRKVVKFRQYGERE
jgi:hypothetical protein